MLAGLPVEQKPGLLLRAWGHRADRSAVPLVLSPEVAAAIDQPRGKTGITNYGVDVLFIDYSPALKSLTVIWMGNDDNKPAEAASGALVAELWGRYMQQLAAKG